MFSLGGSQWGSAGLLCTLGDALLRPRDLSPHALFSRSSQELISFIDLFPKPTLDFVDFLYCLLSVSLISTPVLLSPLFYLLGSN